MRLYAKRCGVIIGLLALALAACGGDEDKKDTPTDTPTAASEPGVLDSAGPSLDLPAGPAVEPAAALGQQMPGCSDADSDECPAPVDLPMQGDADQITVDGVSLRYPSRYFDAASGDSAPEGVLVELTPSANNRYEQRVIFQVYFADSEASALAPLTDPESAAWSTGTLTGTIAVTRDDEADPPASVTIGAFPLADGRVIVLRADTTGLYGWDLWVRVYENILNSLTVTP